MKKSEPKGNKTSAMSRHQKVLIGIAIAFLLYSIAGFIILPAALKNILENKLTENLKRSVSIEAIQINPYLLKISVNKLLVKNLSDDNHFVAFDQFFVDLEAASIFKRALVVKTMTLSNPQMNLARFKDLSYNFSDIIAPSSQEKEASTAPLLFSLNNIQIINGSIIFIDEPKDTTHRIESLNIAVPFLSTVAHEVEINVEPAFSAIVNNTPVKLSGRTIPFHDTRKTVFDIQTEGINITEYLTYIPKQNGLTLQSGFLDITAALGFAMEPGNKPAITLSGDFSLKEISVSGDGAENYLTIPRIDLKLADSKPLEQDIHLTTVSLNDPEFLLRRDDNGNIQPLALFQKDTATDPAKPEPAEKDSSLKLVVDEIVLKRGTVQFEDYSNTEQFQTTLKPVEVKITGLSTIENSEASYNISIKTDAEETIGLDGTLTLNPLGVQAHGNLSDLHIPRFRPFYSDIITPLITSGNLKVNADIIYAKSDNSETIRVENIATQLDSLAVNDKNNKEFLTIPELSITDSSLDLIEQQLTIGNFSTTNGKLDLIRQKDGIVILKELLKQDKTGHKKSGTTSSKASASPWMVTLKKGAIKTFSIVLEDHVPAEPATLLLDKISLGAENISTLKNSKGTINLGFRIDKKGIFSIKGPVTIEPLSTSLTATLADLQIKTLQPYFADKVNLVVGDGAVSLNGKLEVSKNTNREIVTAFKGESSIANFSSFDPVAGEDFLKWKDLRLEGIEYDSAQFALKIKEIGWHNFYTKVVVFNDGGVNLKTIIKDSGKPDTEIQEKIEPEKTTPKGKNLQVNIDTLKLEMGQFDFLDHNITPNYTTSLSELSGSITGLSSNADVMAEVNINGKLDQHAPLIITGKINPLRNDFFADLVFDFKNIELSPTSPYTGKFIGYTVSKGKLSLDLNYLIEGSKINGKNKAFLDQFTLGDTVDSPDAMNLPISLALSLLKNRKGEITLNVPVKGDLNDPKFSIGSIVFKAIINLIAKAATSPFALLGALIPEGAEDLQYIEFAQGSSSLNEEYTKKLKTIAKVLYDRPGLKMDVKGNVNPDQERSVLHENQFQQLLKNEKYKEISKKKEEASSLDEIIIEPEEYNDYLKDAYKEATFEKPKNVLGFTKGLPPEEMEKLLRDNIVITDDDLRLLAIKRANTVKSFLVESGPVEPERLFIIEPKMAEGKSGSQQVEMNIK